MSTRGISLSAHTVAEVVAAPLLMVAPFVLGFGIAAALISIALGALLLSLALQVEAGRSYPERSVVPLSAHRGFDYVLAIVALAGGLAVGVLNGDWSAGIFLVGVGAAQVMLTASTRFTTTRNV